MLKRFVYELKSMGPTVFLFYLVYAATRIADAFLVPGETGRISTLEIILLVSFLVQIGLVVAFFLLVSNNIGQEFEGRSGLKTFLAPLSGCKIILGKWLAILVLALAFFAGTQLFTLLLEDHSLKPLFETMRSAMVDRGYLLGFVRGWFGLDFNELAYFVLWWSMVYFFMVFLWAALHHIQKNSGLILGLPLLRPLLFTVGIWGVDRLLYTVNRLIPLYYDFKKGAMALAPLAQSSYLVDIQRLSWNHISVYDLESRALLGQGPAIAGTAGLIVLCLAFFLAATRLWTKMDR